MKLTIICVLAFLAGMYVQKWTSPARYELHEQWHIVRAGDTLWSIASEYFGEQDRITNFSEWEYHCRKYNEPYLRGKRFLQVGDVVRVPLEVRVK